MLEIKLDEYNQFEPKTIWKLNGLKSQTYWNYAQIGFFANEYYSIFLQGTIGNNPESYIAIDDIHFIDGFCSPQPIDAAEYTTSTMTTTTTLSTQSSIIQLDCDFSKPCSWSNLQTNSFNWTIIKGIDANLFEGPSEDHTGGQTDGAYLVADSRFVRTNRSLARYESLPMNKTKCVEFWYYMYGSNVSKIKLLDKI